MIKLVDIHSVRASTYNPRKSDPERLHYLELSLRKMGFVHPIFADTTGEIISGHQRHYVATLMGLTKIPVEIIPHFDLEKRKSYNVVFNRATNDLKQSDTCETVTQYISSFDIEKMAASMPDTPLDTEDFYPCMRQQNVDLVRLAKDNIKKMHTYAKRIYGTLASIGVSMPVIINNQGEVLNGIGRVMYHAEQGEKMIKAVVLDNKKSEFCSLMLNFLTMDFDIHNRYADTLRYNSFMRSRNTRSGGLGNGFYKGIFPYNKGVDFNPLVGGKRDKWISKYGKSIVDFGAGKLSNTRILRNAGISVSAFEPYFIAVGEEISKEKSLEINKKFLDEIADGREFSSIFISSVFNSVPFMQDRKYIACICAALCSPNTQVICWTQGVNSCGNAAIHRGVMSKTDASRITFNVDYEPNVVLGDFKKLPKVQKFHSEKEIYEIFTEHFLRIKRLDLIDTFIYSEAVGPILNADKLREAIEFEFNLPYPDGTRMKLVDYAKKSFSKRLNISI